MRNAPAHTSVAPASTTSPTSSNNAPLLVRRAPRRQRYSPWRVVRAYIFDLIRMAGSSYQALLAFLALVALSTWYLLAQRPVGFERICPAQGKDACFFPALYETLKLLIFQSTLGLPDDVWGRLLFFALPILGLGLIIQSVGSFGRQAFNKAGRLEAWQVSLASTFRDQIIVCGLGRIGWRIVTQLTDAGNKVVVIERDWKSEFVQQALKLRVPVIHGDAREAGVLRQAGVLRAHAVIADIDDDLLDIEIALAARRENPHVRVILRSFYEDLDSTLNNERNFGPNSAFSASALGAPTFAAAAISRDVIGAIPLGDDLYGLSEVVVNQTGRVQGSLREIEQRFGAHVVRRCFHDKLLAYQAAQQVRDGERLTVVGPLRALEAVRMAALAGEVPEVLRQIPQQHPAGARDTIIVCGLGKVGYRVVNLLHQCQPRPRIVVVHLYDRRPVFADRLTSLESVTLVAGDMRDERVLERAGIERAYAVAALTSDDTANLEAGLAARRLRPDVHLVLRVFSDALAANLSEMFGINTTFSNSNLTSATLTAAALAPDVRYGVEIDNCLFGMADITIAEKDGLNGWSVERLRTHHEALILRLVRGNGAYPFPAPEVTLAPGDALTVLAPVAELARLRK